MKKLTQKQIQQSIDYMENSELEMLLEMLSALPIDVVNNPENGLLMMQSKDSFNECFYLGEVLVSQAEVKYKDQSGYAVLMGDRQDKALCLASVEAILKSEDQIAIDNINRVLSKAWGLAEKKFEDEAILAASTKVNFDNMAEEDYLTK